MRRDKLKDIFTAIKRDAPSMSFENNLMQRIRAEQLRKERRSNKIAIFSIFGGVASMVLIPIVILRFFDIPLSTFFFEPKVDFLDVWKGMQIDPSIFSISVICFVLLMVDTLVRQRIKRKHKED